MGWSALLERSMMESLLKIPLKLILSSEASKIFFLSGPLHISLSLHFSSLSCRISFFETVPIKPHIKILYV